VRSSVAGEIVDDICGPDWSDPADHEARLPEGCARSYMNSLLIILMDMHMKKTSQFGRGSKKA
jgi:hypothetical protein